ncbi:MAG TPA: polyphenol oxidase family protein [Oligoflexia bacterium]|nr:polyphenol oxidase family protein [Oligoflexia bacterium]HMP49683.1 polyphenol oxidase family protein [Oligoflexia bacterium]
MFFIKEIYSDFLVFKCKALLDCGICHGFMGKGVNVKGLDFSLDIKLSETKIASSPNIICDYSSLVLGNSVKLLKQVHGINLCRTQDFSNISNNSLEGDGFLVRSGDGAVGIKTADCVPLILYASDINIAVILHCGWRGTIDGIIEAALQKLFHLGSSPEYIIAATGPAAGSCCYEVGLVVVKIFKERELSLIEQCQKSNISVKSAQSIHSREGKYYASVQSLVFKILVANGVVPGKIYLNHICTICSPDFYSYRRDGDDCGRQLSYLQLIS